MPAIGFQLWILSPFTAWLDLGMAFQPDGPFLRFSSKAGCRGFGCGLAIRAPTGVGLQNQPPVVLG
jgi:hypothetical protein